MQVGMFSYQAPIQPTNLAVLTVAIVISLLGATDFVPHENHGHAERKHGHGQEVFHLAIAQFFDGRIVAGALDAAIPASVIVGSVTVLFLIGLVVLLVVGHKIIECEAIVAANEIYTLLRFALLVRVNFGAANDPVCYMAH